MALYWQKRLVACNELDKVETLITSNYFVRGIHAGTKTYLLALIDYSPTIQLAGAKYASGKGATHDAQ
jgi:hypothetical protein